MLGRSASSWFELSASSCRVHRAQWRAAAREPNNVSVIHECGELNNNKDNKKNEDNKDTKDNKDNKWRAAGQEPNNVSVIHVQCKENGVKDKRDKKTGE